MSRKYRQQGYMDGDREEPRKKAPPRGPLSPEERARRRGLRHALDRDANAVLRCHVCGRSAQALDTVTPDTVCPHCSAPLHCCRTCAHFDSAARWECRTDPPERVADKGKANACPLYSPRLVLDATGKRTDGPKQRPDDARAAFDSLFKR